jgi:translation initiation factor IF-2
MLSAIKSAAGGPVRAKQQPQQAKKFESLKEKKKEERGGKGRGEHVSKFFVKPDKRKQPVSGTTVPKSIEIMESIQVGELAKKLNLKPGDVIAKLMKMGEMVTITKTIDAETATLLAQEYGCETKVISLYDETIIEAEADTEEIRISRPPVVTIMGHVDHGKTKLLDTIRKTNVVATEAGAITQHIGAYQVATPQGKITFLDTPGHEAFTAMRARGAAVTDIVILVVAADDGVKEQTLEAITHAREASIPIIVAVNKIDLPAANIDRIKQELSNHGLQPEDWGGQTIYCEISAKENIGIEHLLEMILLQAEVLDLKANSTIRAIGRVIEAKIDPGKGPVATVLIQKGILREGDPYVVGVFSGRVRTMLDDFGRRLTEAGPATPVEITGIDGVPHAGDPFQVVVNEKYGREIAERRQHYKQITESAKRVQPTLGDLRTWITDHKELKVIIKADVQGSVEAIRDGLNKLTGEDVKVRVIHGATGAISETDVTLASASNAIIVGFQTRATPRAADLADENHVEIKYYSVIYDVIDEVRLAMEGLLEPDKVEEITGRAEIRQIFKISRAGNVAGCMVIKGKIRRNQKIRLIRENVVVYTGSLKSLRRVKDEVSEVAEGFECGIAIDGYNDIRIGDLIEFFDIKEVARKLQA